MNGTGNMEDISAEAVPPVGDGLLPSASDMEDTRRRLIALRNERGAESPVGYRCSNLVELIQNHRECEPGTERLRLRNLIGQQTADLQRLLASPQ